MSPALKSGSDSRTKTAEWNTERLQSVIRSIPDFPKKGILFRDITPALQLPGAFQFVINRLADHLKAKRIDFILGIESRGFIFSSALAYKLNIGFAPVRKQGKLPYRTQQKAYALEYGEAVLEIHEDAFPRGARVAIVDDLLATGGTALAAAQLAEGIGGQVSTIAFLIELAFLKGREKLAAYDIFSLIQYS